MSETELAKRERKVARARKWLLGCSLGCAGLLLLVLILLLAILFWLQAASPMPQPEAFVDEHTTAFALARPNMADPAVGSAVTELLQGLTRSMPNEFEPIELMVGRATREEAGSEEIRPIQVVWTLSRRPEAESFSYLLVVSLDRFKGLFSVLRRGLGRASAPELGPNVTRERHGKIPILIVQEPQKKTVTAIAIFQTSALISNDPQEVRRALDCFTIEPAEFRGPPGLNQLYRDRPRPTEGFALLLNDQSELREILDKIGGEQDIAAQGAPEWDAVRSVQCSAEITSQGALSIAGEAELKSDASKDAVERFIRELLWSLESEGKISDVSVEVEDDSIRVEALLPFSPPVETPTSDE